MNKDIHCYDTTEFVVGSRGQVGFWKPTAKSQSKLTGKQLHGLLGDEIYGKLIEEIEDFGLSLAYVTE